MNTASPVPKIIKQKNSFQGRVIVRLCSVKATTYKIKIYETNPPEKSPMNPPAIILLIASYKYIFSTY